MPVRVSGRLRASRGFGLGLELPDGGQDLGGLVGGLGPQVDVADAGADRVVREVQDRPSGVGDDEVDAVQQLVVAAPGVLLQHAVGQHRRVGVRGAVVEQRVPGVHRRDLVPADAGSHELVDQVGEGPDGLVRAQLHLVDVLARLAGVAVAAGDGAQHLDASALDDRALLAALAGLGGDVDEHHVAVPARRTLLADDELVLRGVRHVVVPVGLEKHRLPHAGHASVFGVNEKVHGIFLWSMGGSGNIKSFYYL